MSEQDVAVFPFEPDEPPPDALDPPEAPEPDAPPPEPAPDPGPEVPDPSIPALERGDDVHRRLAEPLPRMPLPRNHYGAAINGAVAAAVAPAIQDAAPRPWVELGARNIGGHVNALAQDPVNPNTIYAGMAHGGVFRTRDGGDTWEPLGAPEDAFPVGALAVAPSNPRILYVGSGAPNMSITGRGFYRCDTGAAVPVMAREVAPPPAVPPPPPPPLPGGSASMYAAIAVDPHDADRCWVASSTGLWRRDRTGPPGAAATFVAETPPIPAADAATAAAALNLPAGTLPPVTDVVLAERWDAARPRVYRVWAAVHGVGVFRGEWDRDAAAAAANPSTLRVRWDRAGRGTVRTGANAMELLGAGTDFVAQLRPGDAVEEPGGAQAVVDVVNNATRVTLRPPGFAPPLGAGTAWIRVPPAGPGPQTGLAGTIGAAANTGAVAGAGTSFQADFRLGDEIRTTGLATDRARFVTAIGGPLALTTGPQGVGQSPALGGPNPIPAGTGYARVPGSGLGTIDLAGSIQSGPGALEVTGAGTAFGAAGDLQPDDEIVTTGTTPIQTRRVTGITSPTRLTVDRAFDTPVAAGTTFARQPAAGAGLPAAGVMGRIRLAVCRTRPEHVYALMAAAAPSSSYILPLYHSADGGDTWQVRTGCESSAAFGAQAYYDLTVAVHPFEPSLVVAGGVNLYRSRDHGRGWATILLWTQYENGDRAQHGDHHDLLWDAFEPGRLWVANDGGVSVTDDIVAAGNALAPRSWRKRSHGILAAQFNDITVNPRFPFMMGGGLQDNGTFMGYGGPSWYRLDGGDGGEMAFSRTNPRRFFTTWQGGVDDTTVTGAAPGPNDARTPVPELNRVSTATAPAIAGGFPVNNGGIFVGLVEAHPATANLLLLGRRNAAFRWTQAAGPVMIGTGAFQANPGGRIPEASALAFSPSAANTHWWVGTSTGDLFASANGMAGPWVQRRPWPAVAAGGLRHWVARVAVHPQQRRYVAVATAGDGTVAGMQGRVWLSLDGRTFVEITGLAAVNGGGGALQPLPVTPVTSLAWDPAPAAGAAQVLYVGTLAGVFVCRNLPARSAAGVAAGAIPGFVPRWFAFNNRAPADGPRLPLTLVTDLAVVRTPGDAGGPARQKLRCSTYGRGVYECDLGAAPRHRLFVRQHVIEDGLSYPRPAPATLNATAAGALAGDPRFPALPAAGSVRFDETHAYDIRVDRPPFRFFQERVDGVEFDEEATADTLLPGERNCVYVQLHNRGWDAVAAARVHLYFMPLPAPGMAEGPALAALAAPAAATFWNPPSFDPAPGSAWQRAGTAPPVTDLRPGQPIVSRFDWVVPDTLGGRDVALLALAESVPHDALPGAAPASIAALVRNERRAALRIVRADAYVPDVYVRDGLEDGGAAGAVALGGRSPDIMVVHGALAGTPDQVFRDLAARRDADHLKPGPNEIYVRVHNRRAVPVQVNVELWHAKAWLPGSADFPFDEADWSQDGVVNQAAAAAPAVATLPANGWAVAHFTWTDPGDPDPAAGPAEAYRAYLLMALVRAVPAGDPLPLKAQATPENVWAFFRTARDSGNAALRGVRWRSA